MRSCYHFNPKDIELPGEKILLDKHYEIPKRSSLIERGKLLLEFDE